MSARDELRKEQEATPGFGLLYRTCYTFIHRTMNQFFPGEWNYLPILCFDQLPGSIRGQYRPRDGYMLEHVIQLDPTKFLSGVEMAETLVHEVCHFVEDLEENLTSGGRHGERFEWLMLQVGIVTRDGAHIGRILNSDQSAIWENWLLVENEDLEIADFVFK